ncbi:MAG: MG2 domain-containing protein [Planctomycetota bacterium]
MNCASCQDLLFDFVFGLLDPPEETALREHLAGCPACALELAKAKADQLKLGQAALAIRDVAPFAMPNEPLPQSLPTVSETFAQQPVKPARRGVRPLTIAAWLGTAACCVVVAGLFVFQQRERVAVQESRVATLLRQRESVEAQLASLPAKFADEQKQIPELAHKDAVQVHLAGPGSVTPGVSANPQVALRDLDGAMRSGTVEVEFLRPQGQAIKAGSYAVEGVTEIPIPAELAATPGPVQIRVAAAAADGKAVGALSETMEIRPGEQAGHLATNKLLYRPGDKLQVRALVLDRVTLQPPTTKSKVSLSLLNSDGQPVVPAFDVATLAGMGAGEIRLPDNLGEGTYTLEARGSGMAAVTRRIEVLPATAPPAEVLTRNNRYRAGEPIAQSVQIFNKDGTPAANTPVFGNAVIVDQKAEARPTADQRNNADNAGNQAFQNAAQNRAPVNFQGQTDAAGKYLIQLPGVVDSQTARQQLQADISYGAQKQSNAKVLRDLQVQPSQVVVEFFPEGGRLIAGTRNKIFYRVRAPEGDAVANARFVVNAGAKRLFDSGADASVGSFEFVPETDTAYSLKILSPRQAEIRDPFAPQGVQAQGLLVRGASVQNGGGPLQVALENRGADKLVQIVATSRGQVVAHARMNVAAGVASLALPMSVDGVIRVTALEAKDGQLVPLTERLFFRSPARTLDIAVQADADKSQPQVKLTAKGRDERQQPLAFWALASVVDDRFHGDVPETSLSAHFLLLGDAPTDVDLSELPIVGLDGPPRDLDLALGIFGWRRLEAPALRAPLAMAKAQRKVEAPRPAEVAAGPSFYYRVEPSVAELQQRHENDRQIALVQAALNRKTALLQERTDIAAQLVSARAVLDELSLDPRKQLMTALGSLALALLAVGALGMLFGLAQLLRHRTAGMTFGVSCACLAGCLALLVFRSDDAPQGRVTEVAAAARPLDEFRPEMRMAALAEKADGLRQGHVKLQEARPADAMVREKAAARDEGDRPAAGMAAAVQGGLGRGDQLARLDPAKHNLVRELKEAEMNRGVKADADKAARSVALEPKLRRAAESQPVATGAGLGGGGVAAATPGAMPSVASPLVTSESNGKSAKGAAQPGAVAPRIAAPQAPANLGKEQREEQKKQLADGAAVRVNLDQLPREFGARRSQELADPATLFWNPALFVPSTGVTFPIDLPSLAARYRVLFLGHTEDGRLGIYEGALNAK